MTRPFLLSHLVPHQADRDADAPAVRAPGVACTYGELAARTEALAATLGRLGVRRGDRVGLYLAKSVDAFAAIHGVLRAGAAYVPIDPLAPAAVVAAIVADCGIEVLVSEDRARRVLDELAAGGARPLRAVVGPSTAIDGLETVAPADVRATGPWRPPKVLSDDLAYVMYTSGSTGRPKGLMHTHRSGLRYAELAVDTYGVRPEDRLANSAPFHFDISTFEVFAGPLAGSSTLVIPEPYLKLPASLSQLVAGDRSTFWYSVPFLLSELLLRGALDQRDLTSLRWVLFGGEVVDPATITALMAALPNARFSNSYGPAEVNQCTFWHLPGPPAAEQAVPIGSAWGDAELDVVGEDGRPVADGEAGELLVRTSTMMDGYWGRPDLDREAFVHRPLPGGRSARWYATGDLVRRRPDGVHEFLGRRDHQVKVRGNRVELESVEAVLGSLPGIAQAVAGIVEVGGTTALAAGVTLAPGAELDLDATLRVLATRLPPYAVPFRVVVLDALPLTGSGKVDRRAVRGDLARRLDPQGATP